MPKSISLILSVIMLSLMLIPTIIVHAETEVIVKDETELKNAINNSDVNTITLGDTILTTEKITITRPLTINGNGHTIKYVGTFGADGGKDNKVWSGIYVLQIYRTNVTLKNIKLTGGNAALLVNGSNVTLAGTIDVSGNGFGGIELAQGKGVTETVKVTFADDINLVNTTENEAAPTMWVPSDSDPAILVKNGESVTIKSGEELTLKEITDLFKNEEVESPQTSDALTIYLASGALGLLSLGACALVLLKQKNEEF